VHHSILCGDALCWVAFQHLIKEVQTKFIKAGHELLQKLRLILRVIWLEERQILHCRPGFKTRCATPFEDFHELVFVIMSWEERSSGDQLGENATHGPNIDRCVVVLAAHQNIGGSVPQCDDLVSEVLHRNAKGAGKTEIGKLKDAFSVNEKVLRLEISVQHFMLVTLRDSVQELIQIRL